LVVLLHHVQNSTATGLRSPPLHAYRHASSPLLSPCWRSHANLRYETRYRAISAFRLRSKKHDGRAWLAFTILYFLSNGQRILNDTTSNGPQCRLRQETWFSSRRTHRPVRNNEYGEGAVLMVEERECHFQLHYLALITTRYK
jgi:hypothetical protein